MKAEIVLVMLILSGFVFAETVEVGSAIWESGDAGESFAQEKSQEMCAQPGVEAVYICLGNSVKVVWEDESRGCTFYEPEGNVVECPDVAPTDMGAECMQMMMPNYCPDESVCGQAQPQEFPGETYNENQEYEEEESPSEKEEATQPPEEETPEQQETQQTGYQETTETSAPAAQTKETSETAMDNLVWIVLFLGVATVAVLYLMFKKLVKQK